MHSLRSLFNRFLIASVVVGLTNLTFAPVWAAEATDNPWGPMEIGLGGQVVGDGNQGAKTAGSQVMLDQDQEVALDTPDAIKDYRLSVGDAIAVNLWATDLRFSQTYSIPFEGRIYVPSLGEVNVNKLTTEQVQAELLKRLGGRVHNLRASVLLVKTRRVSVYVTGLVGNPGAVSVPVLSRLSYALAHAGGVTSAGSIRRLTIAHAGQKPQTFDYFQFLNRGDLTTNPRLQAGDVINVPPVGHQVIIQGAVYRPGRYETLGSDGQTLKDLLAQAGGPTVDAGLRSIQIYHQAFSGGTSKTPDVINAYKMLFEGDASQNPTLTDGDLVMIPSNKLPTEDSVVNVQGIVGHPGRIPYRQGARLSDYLNAAGGPEPKSDLRHVSVSRAGHSFKVDAYRIMREGHTEGDIELQAGDIVYVPESFFYVANAQDVINVLLAALAVWAAVRPLTGK